MWTNFASIATGLAVGWLLIVAKGGEEDFKRFNTEAGKSTQVVTFWVMSLGAILWLALR